MRKFISSLLVFAFFLMLIPSFSLGIQADMPSPSVLNGYENICLTYTFRTSGLDYGRHYENDLMPYVAYLDRQGNIKDFFFDSYLFLPCVDYGPSGARMHYDENNPTLAIDWTTYVDDTFHPNANVNALDTAFGKAKEALGDDTKKAGVFFTILYPSKKATNFGTLGGKSLNLSKIEDRKYAIKWMIDEQIARYKAAGYENLDLVGFYWLEETIFEGSSYDKAQNNDVTLLNYASEYLHSLGLKFIWIPWYMAEGYKKWNSYGFDLASMQPNYYWAETPNEYKLSNTVSLANRYGMSMEMELDSRVSTVEYLNRYQKYLQYGITSGAMNSVKTYYQDGKTAVFYSACYSNNEVYRRVYDLTYKYAKRTLTLDDLDFNMQQDDELPDDVNWVSVGKDYESSAAYYDGNGLGYQEISGKELTDAVIGTSDLGTEWHGFHYTRVDVNGQLSATIDLGKVYTNLTHFVAHFNNFLLHGIGKPRNPKFYISEDGIDFKLIDQPSLTENGTYSYLFFNSSEHLSARYFKVTFLTTPGYPFVFCSEVLVGEGTLGEPEPEPDPDPIPTPDPDPTPEPEPETFILGDVNGNNSIDSRDYVMAKRGYFKTLYLSDDHKKRADVNRNGRFDAKDYIYIKRLFFGTYKIV